MRVIEVKAVHFLNSIYLMGREHTYLEGGDRLKMFYIPELNVIELQNLKDNEVRHANYGNVKHYLPTKGSVLDKQDQSEETTTRSSKASTKA